MKSVVQVILCVLLSLFTIVGVIVSLVGAFYGDSPGDVKLIVSGALIVAVSSFSLTLAAKVLDKDHTVRINKTNYQTNV